MHEEDVGTLWKHMDYPSRHPSPLPRLDTSPLPCPPQAVCMHEEDVGTLWKHVDYRNGHSEQRRSRRLVINFVSTVVVSVPPGGCAHKGVCVR